MTEIESQAAAAPLSNRLRYLKQQYRGIAATPPAAAPSAWGGQRKLLRQMDVEPGGAGRAVLSGETWARPAVAYPRGSATAGFLDHEPARNDFDQYPCTCPTKDAGSGT